MTPPTFPPNRVRREGDDASLPRPLEAVVAGALELVGAVILGARSALWVFAFVVAFSIALGGIALASYWLILLIVFWFL